jgi:hypothetical protein
VWLATARRPADATAVKAARVRYAPAQWSTLVERAALDGLAVVRRLATGIAPSEVTDVQVALHEVAERFAALRAGAPMPFARDDDLVERLQTAADGANAEASRLSGVTVMRTDRKAFLGALRALRDIRVAAEAAPTRPHERAATGEVAPSFTVA